MAFLEKRIEILEDRNKRLEQIEKLFGGEEDGFDIVAKVKNLDKLVKALMQQNGDSIVHDNMLQESNTESERSTFKLKAPTNLSRPMEPSKMRTPQIVKRQLPGRVAFCVGLSNYMVNSGIHRTIIFDEIIANVGNAYSSKSGIFSVPVSGHYVMSLVFNAGVQTPSYQRYLEVVSNGVALADVLLDSSSSIHASSTKVWVFFLERGSEVWVRTPSYSVGNDILGHLHSMLTGWLLYAV
ncbi:hypothetical protein DPMN_085154 [Dreissena polymorpha]|uniref:C1q domain-containing protein n=1 Tax=Dreissena polymorpha TaxID=45954 RepID=A0A9D3YFJ0_DREPO|nr:hypothetical protein DPMN_085154 [Dreissena polymorpha]